MEILSDFNSLKFKLDKFGKKNKLHMTRSILCCFPKISLLLVFSFYKNIQLQLLHQNFFLQRLNIDAYNSETDPTFFFVVLNGHRQSV